MVKTKKKCLRSPSEEDDDSQEPTKVVQPQRSMVVESDSSTESDSEGSMQLGLHTMFGHDIGVSDPSQIASSPTSPFTSVLLYHNILWTSLLMITYSECHIANLIVDFHDE